MALPEDETTIKQPSIDYEALGLEPVSDEELFGLELQTEAPEAPNAETPEIDYEALGLEPVSEEEIFGFETPKTEVQKPSENILRQAADLPVQFAIGITNSVKGLTDLFGADNAVSQNLSQNADWYRGLLSASAKQDEEEVGRILQEAEGKGILDQLSAGLEAFTVAPADFVASGLGSLATFAATGIAGRAAAAAGAARAGLTGAAAAKAVETGVRATQLATGAAMGAGIVKGEIYQSVKDEMLANGKTEEESRKIAMEAQSYMGKNLDQILLGAGLGTIDAFTGAEKILGKVLTKGGLKPDASRIGNILKGGITEAAPEFVQAAQEKFASNLALRREGADVSLTQGVFSQGALEGLVGLGMGIGAGAVEPRIQAPPTKEEVSAAASETQDVARQNKDIVPATASLVEGEAEQIIQSQAETPDERVARLQREAQEAAGIDLEEEGAGLPPVEPTPPVTPTPEAAVVPVEPVVPTEGAVEPAVTEVAPETVSAPVVVRQGEAGVDTNLTAEDKAYRGMTEEEFNNTVLGAGGVESRGDFRFGEEGTNFAEKFEDAESYINFGRDDPRKTGKPTYIVEVDKQPLQRNRRGDYEAFAPVAPTKVWKITAQDGELVATEMQLPAAPEAATAAVEPTPVAPPPVTPEAEAVEVEVVPREEQAAQEREEIYQLFEMERMGDRRAGEEAIRKLEEWKQKYPQAHRAEVQRKVESSIRNNYPITNAAELDELGITPPENYIRRGNSFVPTGEIVASVPTLEAPVTPQLEPLRRVARAEQTEEDVAGLVDAGFVEVYNGQPVITQAGIDALPEAERPRLTPEARKIQIDTRTSEAAAEAISKNLRIGVDQVPVDVRMPAGWTLVGDVYVPPQPTARITPSDIETAVVPEEVGDVFANLVRRKQEVQPAVLQKPVGSQFQNPEEFRAAFDLRGQGHTRFAIRLDLMQEDGAITEHGKNLILATIWDNNTNDEFLSNMEMGSARKNVKSYGYGGRSRQTVEGGRMEQKPLLEMQRRTRIGQDVDKRTALTLSTFWHEFGHAGYYSLLSAKQKKAVDDAFNKTTRAGRIAFFAEGRADLESTDWFSKYYSKSKSEWFAQSFAEYVITQKSDQKKLVPVFEQLLDKIKAVLSKLFNRREQVNLNDIFDFILRGEAYGQRPTWQGYTMSTKPAVYGTRLGQAISPEFTKRLLAREGGVAEPAMSDIDRRRQKIIDGITLRFNRSANMHGNDVFRTEYDFGQASPIVEKLYVSIEQFDDGGVTIDYLATKKNNNQNIKLVELEKPFKNRTAAVKAIKRAIAEIEMDERVGGAEIAPTPEVREARREPAITQQQVQSAINESRAKREQNVEPEDVEFDGEDKAYAIAPSETIGKSLRDVLRIASETNLTNTDVFPPSEQTMQDVAAVLSQLDGPVLDSETVVSLESRGYGRDGNFSARRFPDGAIGVHDNEPQSVETYVHEASHSLTVDQIDKYLNWETSGSGKDYIDSINRAIADPATPEPVKRLFSLYTSTLDQLGLMEQFGGVDGVANWEADARYAKQKAQSRQRAGKIRKDLDNEQIYGLVDMREFVAQTFSSESFRDLLKTLKDPNAPQKSLWSAFVEAIQKILNLPKSSMAAAVIQASVDISTLGEVTPKRTGAGVGGIDREVRVTPQQDRDYLDAVERGDLETAQRMVDDAAKKAGYYPKKLYHGTPDGRFYEFDVSSLRGVHELSVGTRPVFLTTSENVADEFRGGIWVMRSGMNDKYVIGKDEGEIVKAYPKHSEVKALYAKFDNLDIYDFFGGAYNEETVTNLLKSAKKSKKGGVVFRSMADGSYTTTGRMPVSNIVAIFDPKNIKSADPVTRDDQGNIIPLSQRFQPEQADIRYRRRVQMGRAGMEPSAVEARLQELGFPTGGIIRVVNQPDADFEGRTIILDGKVTGIELNASALKDNAAIDRVLNHEFAESANADGALNKLVERLTPKEKKEINDTITRLRYEERARTTEEAARAIETLAEAWKGRGFFTRAVARVEAWASKLGFKLTRRAAEYIAARNLADINSGFKTAYNRFINVKGEAREGRAFVTTEENARFLELAKDPEANREELQKMVEDAAFRAGYTIRAFHGTSEEFTTFDTSLRNLDTARYGEGLVFFTNNPDLAQEYAQLGSLEFRRANAERETAINEFEKISEETFPDLQRIAIERRGLEIANERVASGQITQEQYNAWVNAENRVFDATQKLQDLQKLPARPKVMPVFLKMDQPVSEKVEGQEFFGSWNFVLPNLVEQMRSRGGDGVIAEGVYDSPFGTPLKSTVYAIPNSEQAKSADPVTYDDQGNVIPLNERFQPTTTDIRYARREVRESRREPEAIPTFTEGSPEAATLKEMEASMAKVDAASEAKGGKPETYKISEIASVWMDSGLGERELQDAIVEYTNLTPANAARVAKAIARQYDIQQSIATAFLETQTGLSVEALPEGVTLPKEVDPDRPRPVMQRLFDVFMGVRVPPTKLTVNEKAALKDQIRLKAAANRAAKAAQKETSDQVIEVIKAMDLRGGVRPKQVQALAKRAAKVIWTNEKSVETFTDYAAKVVENANYDADLREAKAAQARAKQLSKQKKKIAAPQREVLDNIAKIPVNRLDDPRMYADAVNYYLRGFKAVLSPDYVVIPDSEMTGFLSQMESETTRNQRELDRAVNQRLAEKYEIDPDDVNSVLEAVDIIKQIQANENREAMDNLLTDKAVETQAGLKTYDQTSLRPDQRKVVDFMMKVDPRALDAEERQRFIRITNNIIYNNQTNGAEYFASVAKGQQNARQAAQDGNMVAKNKAWINLLPRIVSEKMQRGWALELQSIADTFRNAFGKGAMAKVYKAMGMLDLNMGFTKANNTIDEIQEKIAEFHRGLEKKYKAAARNQDGLLAEGVAGFLIQAVPNKGETESIAQRRDLIKQDIANRRESREADRIAMADRIEAILNQIDGEGVQAVLNKLKQAYPANYESLVWYKDTLLPQYKDFLKNFDENFNDQANNYDNPNYLPIAFSKASPSLAITPEEEQVFFDQVSLTPKQSAYTIKRVDYTTLPEDRTTNRPKEIEFNLRRNAFDSLSDQINKAYTSAAWQQIASFMKTPEAKVVFGGQANKDFFIERLNRLRLSRMRRGAMSRGNIERAVDALSVISRKLGTGIALGGIYQWIKQPPDQLITALGSGGRYDLMAQNIMPKNQKAARELLRKFSIGRRGDASAGYKYINQMEGHQNRLERYFSESKWDQVKEEGGKIADVWMAALKQSDFWAASTAWMTYYEGELNKRDIKIEDWAKEAELVDTDPARQEAAAFAEQMTDIYQGSSDPTQMATFAQSGKSGWENLMKAIFVPFNSFAIQQRMRIYSDARDVLNGEKSGVGGLSGTIGGLLLFHATKRLALPVISGGIATILYGLLGVDMDEPDEEKQKEEANKRWRQMQGEMLGNLLVGGTPQIVEAKFIDAMNYASYLIALQLESESVLNDEGEVMSFDQYAKERSPFWRYRSFDNAMSLGMLDIGLGQAEQAILQTKMVASPEEMEMYTPEEQRLLYFSALSEWLYLMRLNDADFARIVTKARRDMVAAAKEREKEMKRIREGR